MKNTTYFLSFVEDRGKQNKKKSKVIIVKEEILEK
jgi:hypothetical protein